jgi:hypothetical protein
MKKKIHVVCNALSGNIYCGHFLKQDPRTPNVSVLSTTATEVTEEAVFAVAEHAVLFKEQTDRNIVLSINGKHKYKIIVEEL